MYNLTELLPLAHNAKHSPSIYYNRLIILTLGAHAPEGYGSWVCVSVCLSVCLSVCYLTSHFSNVRLSHKRYDLSNGQ